jgi:predicted phage terminase large subunit-like protein
MNKKAEIIRAENLKTAIKQYPEEALRALRAANYEDNLSDFVECAWKYIDPNPYVWGWHLDAISEHLTAVTRGEIRRLVINIPPRTSKSSMVSVSFPAWVWAQSQEGSLSGPHVQFLFASYAQSLSIRDSIKTRRLIESPFYQEHWGHKFAITSDQNTKVRFDNDKGGYRLATSVGGALTGEGGSIIIVDDPHNAQEAESDLVRESTLEWWDQSLSTRLNDPKTGAYIVIMQRLHENDLTGHILSKDIGNWTHLCLPMRFEADRRCITRWFIDVREEGELLIPERFGPDEVSELERNLGPYAAAGQLQQRPQPKGGGIIKRDWWILWDETVAGSEGRSKTVFPEFEYIVASLDTAYTTKQENDYSALTIWGIWTDREGNRRIMLVYAWQDRLELGALVTSVAKLCTKFKIDKLLIESKAAGISVAQELRRLFSREDWGIQLVDPGRGDKVARAYAIQHLFSDGMIYSPDFEWAEKIISQAESFPKGAHDDLVDSMTQALTHLRLIGFAQKPVEIVAEKAESMLYKPHRPQPLYPV